MAFKGRIDWGECENCDNKDCLLTVFIHHPTGVEMWVCPKCTKNFDEAIQQKQVPGKLGIKIQGVIKIG